MVSINQPILCKLLEVKKGESYVLWAYDYNTRIKFWCISNNMTCEKVK